MSWKPIDQNTPRDKRIALSDKNHASDGIWHKPSWSDGHWFKYVWQDGGATMGLPFQPTHWDYLPE